MSHRFALMTVVSLGCAGRGPTVAPAEPTRRAPSELASIIESQAYHAHLSIDGIAFLDSILYVTTNVGLLEVHGRELRHLYQWYGDDNVVSGPWSDEARERIWLQRDHDNVLLRLDRAGWQKIALPEPPSGTYTRGDILEGFRGIGDSAGFRLVGAGHVWKWSEPSAWAVDSTPPADELSGTIGSARVGNRELYVVSSGGCGYLTCINQGFWHDGGHWGAPVRLAVASVKDVLAASHSVFVRGNQGELLRVDRDAAVVMRTPGLCEAIARTSDGRLIASFRKAGIFVLDAGWRKLLDDPVPTSEGEQWAFLAEHKGVIAFATTTVPQLKSGTTDTWYESGTLGLWVSDGARLMRVETVR